MSPVQDFTFLTGLTGLLQWFDAVASIFTERRFFLFISATRLLEEVFSAPSQGSEFSIKPLK